MHFVQIKTMISSLHNKRLFSINFLLHLVLLVVASSCVGLAEDYKQQQQQTLETINYRDETTGLEMEEYAFARPNVGLPGHLLEMFCASIKMRLYWGVFRDEVKETRRKGLYLRRMARLARHIYVDIRDADKPFNETMLSQPDEAFAAPLITGAIGTTSSGASAAAAAATSSAASLDENSPVDRALDKLDQQEAMGAASKVNTASSREEKKKLFRTLKGKVSNLKKSLSSGDTQGSSSSSGRLENLDEIEHSEPMQELTEPAQQKVKLFLKYWAPKVALGVLTRWRTMWWLMMSCLFAKYYLWDPALDEYIKLQRNLVMWPQLQVTKMHQLDQCKPIQFFKRLLDTCKVLNPLMHADFGQFSLDKLTRFKSDT